MRDVIKSLCAWYLGNTQKPLYQDKSRKEKEIKIHDELEATLTKEQRKRLDEFFIAIADASYDQTEDAFARGFKIGALFMREIERFDPNA